MLQKTIPAWLCAFLLAIFPVFANSTTWKATTNNNLNNANNWSNGVPVVGDDALFDSEKKNIETHPKARADFSPSTIQFLESARRFQFKFSNCILTFSDNTSGDVGIFGQKTNTVIKIANKNNNIANQLLLNGHTSNTTGSAAIYITNKAKSSTGSIGVITDSQLKAVSPFVMGQGGILSAANEGNFSSSGSPAQVGYVTGSQLLFGSSFTADDDAAIIVSNSGKYNGNSSSNFVGKVAGTSQFSVGDSFNSGDNTAISIVNRGRYKGSSGGMNEIGYLEDSQFSITGSYSSGNNATITLENRGRCQGDANMQLVGYTNSNQFDIAGSFISGDHAAIDISNCGRYEGNGDGNRIGFVQNAQLQAKANFLVGDHAAINLSNRGRYNGNGNSNEIGTVATAYEFGTFDNFSAGDHAAIDISNCGRYEGNGDMNKIGFLGLNQFRSNGFCVGDNATISISNHGEYSGANSGNGVGMVTSQFVTNLFCAGCKAAITITNRGKYNGGGSSNSIGNLVTFPQFQSGTFSTCDDASIALFNSGKYNGDGDSNHVGFVSSNQMETGDFNTGDNAIITLNNRGSYKGDGSSNKIGYVVGSQFLTDELFYASNNTTIKISNHGKYKGNGSGNLIGYISPENQFDIEGTYSSRDNTKIAISNKGKYQGTGTGNQVGFIGQNQLFIKNSFIAGKNLNLSVKNLSNGSTQAGIVTLSQIEFSDICFLGDGSLIRAFNSGTVGGDQIHFSKGFEIRGKATIKAANSSNMSNMGNGIVVENGTGGDANIVLKNSSFIVNSPFTFTIGELNGNSTSFVQCIPVLNIDTDPHVLADFEGDIQTATALIKRGLGTQKLSGVNTFTGSTTVKAGTLNLTGSLVGPVDIQAAGTLSGTGTIGDIVTNKGTISPGESIGTLAMAGFINQKGTYDVEVNGRGKSDLIKVKGSSNLNGGTVVVSSVNGTYKFHNPYTILTSGTLQGKFSDAIVVSPLIVPELSYGKQNVFLDLATAIHRAATTCNECKVAFQLDNILTPNDRQNELLNEIVNLSIPEAQVALNSLTGQQHTHDAFIAEVVNRQFIRRLYDPLRFTIANCYIPQCSSFLAWAEGGGQFSSFRGDRNARGYSSNGYEITGGVQTSFRNCFTCGLAGSYENDSLHYKRHGGSGKCRTWLIGLYGLYRPERFYALADLAYGRSNNTMDRKVVIGSTLSPIHSKPKISAITFYGEAGIDLWMNHFIAQPFVAVEAGGYCKNQIKEHGLSGWELIIKKQERSYAASRLGLHLTACGLSSGWAASVDGAWNYRSYNQHIRERFVEFGSDFTIEGVKLNSNSVDYALTLSKCLTGKWRFYVEGTGENWNRASNYSVLAGCQFQW